MQMWDYGITYVVKPTFWYQSGTLQMNGIRGLDYELITCTKKQVYIYVAMFNFGEKGTYRETIV